MCKKSWIFVETYVLKHFQHWRNLTFLCRVRRQAVIQQYLTLEDQLLSQDSPCCIYGGLTRFVRKAMRLIRENSSNWRYVHTRLIFFKITTLSINTPLPAVLPRVVARLAVLNWYLLQTIRQGSLQHVFSSPKMVSFQAGFEPGKQKEIRRGQRCPNHPTAQTWPRPTSFCFPGSNPARKTPFWDC